MEESQKRILKEVILLNRIEKLKDLESKELQSPDFEKEKLKEIKQRLKESKRELADLRKLNKENKLSGGALKAGLIKQFFEKSHESEPSDVGSFKVDRDISNKFVRVYYNEKEDHPVVVHRGSSDLKDAFYDAQLLFDIKDNKRFKISKETQKKAEEKYGTKNMTVLGSSLGGKLAEDSASPDVKEIITSGRPETPGDVIKGKKHRPNQLDVRTDRDPVALLQGANPNPNEIKLKSKDPLNPVKSHIGPEVFSEKYFDKDQLIGFGDAERINKMTVSQLKEFIKSTRRAKKLKAVDYRIHQKKKEELRRMAFKVVEA